MDKDEAMLRLVVRATFNSARGQCANAGLTEHPLLPLDMWRACINAGTTQDGYWQWVQTKVLDMHMEMFPKDAVFVPGGVTSVVVGAGGSGGGVMGAQQNAHPQTLGVLHAGGGGQISQGDVVVYNNDPSAYADRQGLVQRLAELFK